METQQTGATASEAVEIIQHSDMVALSGFTPVGLPKTLPTVVAHGVNEQHETKKPCQIRLLTDASISAAVDDVFSDTDAVPWRASYQTSSGLRKKIDRGTMGLVGLYLSGVMQMANYDFLDNIDITVIGASASAPGGQV